MKPMKPKKIAVVPKGAAFSKKMEMFVAGETEDTPDEEVLRGESKQGSTATGSEDEKTQNIQSETVNPPTQKKIIPANSSNPELDAFVSYLGNKDLSTINYPLRFNSEDKQFIDDLQYHLKRNGNIKASIPEIVSAMIRIFKDKDGDRLLKSLS